MKEYKLIELDSEKTNSIRAEWIEQVEKNDDSSLELNDSLFDVIISQKSYGDLLRRSNQETYMALTSDDTGTTDAIVDIIFVRQGAKSLCKIMDIYHAPNISNLDDPKYFDKCHEILRIVLSNMLEINKTTKHGITKVYARDDAAQKTIQGINKTANKQHFEDIGFEMFLAGHRWLEFRKI